MPSSSTSASSGKKNYWVTRGDLLHAREWFAQGYTEALKTPDETLVFVTPEEKVVIRRGPGRLHGLPQPVRLLLLGGQ